MVLAALKICSFYPMMHENSAGQPKASDAPVSLAQKFYDTLMAMQFASTTSLALFQENVLKDLIEAVAAESAFYRPRLAPVLDAKGKADLALWHKIPILTQADVVANADRLRTTTIPKAHGRIFRYQSSGTTGWSIAYSRSELADLAVTCGQHRHLSAMNIDWSRDIALIRAFDPALTRFRRRPEEPQRKDSWGPGWLAPENLGVVHRLSVFTPIEEQLAWLVSLGPVYLNTFPSNALALARHIRKNPRAKPNSSPSSPLASPSRQISVARSKPISIAPVVISFRMPNSDLSPASVRRAKAIICKANSRASSCSISTTDPSSPGNGGAS